MSKRKGYSKKKWAVLIIVVLFILGIIFLLNYSTDVTKNTDDFVYELPYQKGTQSKIVQGYGGLFTHKYIAAIDFEMPEGTTICATRGGTVYAYRDNSDEGGIWSKYKNKANFIIIRHDDGSFGCYWHLKKNGVLIKEGKVQTGQPIALSGATGQVLRPHLHFSVKRKFNYDMDSFVKTKFHTNSGTIQLISGRHYTRPVE